MLVVFVFALFVLKTLGLFVGMMIGFGVLEVIFEVKQSREPEIKVWTNRLFFAGVGIFVVMLVASALLGSYAAWRKAKAGVKWPPKT